MLVLLAFLLAACKPANGRAVAVAVTPSTQLLPKGTSLQLAAMATTANGSQRDITAEAQWHSSDPAVAAVDPATPGLVRARAVGSVTITATDPTTRIASSTLLTVTPAVLVSLAVTPPNPSIAVGTTQQFAATGTYSDNTTRDLTAAVDWSSLFTGVATIGNAADSKGLATSRATGSTLITATDPATHIAGSATLTVSPAVLVSIAVTPPSPSIALGTSQQFTATGTYTDHTTQDLTTAVTWSSSVTAVAAIGNAAGGQGLATSRATGSTSITATDPATGIAGSATLTVTPAALVSIAVTPPSPSIALGTSQQFTATGTYTDDTTQDLTTAVTWSSSDEGVATIGNAAGSHGLAASAATGGTSITATDPARGITGSTTLAVTPAALVALDVTPANPSIPLGTSQQFTATGTYTDHTTQDLTTAVTWTSSASGVATISNAAGSQGLASSAATGGTSITAIHPGTAIAGSTTLTVTRAVLVSLAVTPADPSIPLGTSQQYIATGTYTDHSIQDLTTAVTWSSSLTGVATVSNAAGSQGLASSAATGGTTITATDPATSVAGSTTLTVTPAVLVWLAVTPVDPSIPLGTTQQFTATGTYTDNSTQDLTTAVTWSSFAIGVATISNAAGSHGLASSTATGGTSITATDPATGIARSTTLTVTPAVLVSLAVTPANPSIPLGTTQQFTAIGTYTDNSTQNLTTAVTWSSSATGVATISNAAGSEGLASGSSPGITGITATDPGTSIAGGAQLEIVNRITFVGASSRGAGPAMLTLNIATPSGTQAGDVMIASIAIRPNTSLSPPAGWTLVRRTNSAGASPNSLAVYWRRATAAEPVSHTWMLGSSSGSAGGILAFRGVDAVAPIVVENGQATPESLSHTTPSVETTVADTMLVTSHGYASSGTWTPPAGMTEGFDVRSQSGSDANGITACGNWSRQTAAGATGIRIATASNSPDTGNAHILALRPAP
jgi:hypothetical protein